MTPSPTATRPPQARLVGLDGLRGIAILLVFAVHWTLAWSPRLPADGAWTAAAAATFAVGNLGVDLFFVLSGFLIYDHCLTRPMPAGRFLARRAWRVYPAYLPVLALYVAMALASPSSGKLPHDPVEAALYVLRCLLLLPGIVQEHPLVGVAWSLSYEALFYLVLPPFLHLGRMRERPAGQRCALIAAMAAAILAFSLASGLHERLLAFPAGMLARELAVGRPRLVSSKAFLLGVPMVALAALAAVAVARVAWPFLNPDYPTSLLVAVLASAAFAPAIPAALAPGGAVAALATCRPLRFLGDVSYSYYLVHNLAIRAILAVVPAALPAWCWLAAMPVGLALTLLPGLALYRLVEKPCLSWRPGDRPWRNRIGPRLAVDKSAIPNTLP